MHSSLKIKLTSSLVLLLVLISFPAFGLPWCGRLLTTRERQAVEEIVNTFGAYTFDAASADAKQYPTQLLEGDQSGYQLFLSDGFEWPLAIQVPDEPNNLWRTLNTRQQIYLLRILEMIFRDNDYDHALSDENIVTTITKRLGFTWDDISELESKLIEPEYERYRSRLPKWLSPFKQNVVATLLIALRSPRVPFESRFKALYDTFKQLPEIKQQEIRGISARRVFELAHDRQNCVGACRQANSVFAAILLEIGIPVDEVRLKCGILFIPFTGHEWTQVKVGKRWRNFDATPANLALLPKFLRAAMTLFANAHGPFNSLVFPLFRKAGIENGLRPIWKIESKSFQVDPK